MIPLLFAVALSLPIDVHVGGHDHSIVQANEPFDAAALTWSGEATMRLRVSKDGVNWSDWITPTIDEDITERHATAITHFQSSRYLEYAFDGRVDRVTVTLFPPLTPSLSPHSGERVQGEGHIVSRVDWNCPDGEGAPLWTPAYTTVTHAVVHHTAGSNDLADWATEVRNIWYFHTFTNGWGDIGYNFLIDPNGVIYEGRAGGNAAIGAHFSCRNTNTVGVALLGTFISTSPTPPALDSLERLLAELTRRNSIDPNATVYHPPTGLNLPTIIGHRDGNTSIATCSRTECPGDVLYALLPSIRSAVFALNAPPLPRRRAVKP